MNDCLHEKKKPVLFTKQTDKLKLLKKLFPKFNEASFFIFLKKEQVLKQQKGKKTSVWKIIFSYPFPTLLKKTFVYNYKNPPAKNRKNWLWSYINSN